MADSTRIGPAQAAKLLRGGPLWSFCFCVCVHNKSSQRGLITTITTEHLQFHSFTPSTISRGLHMSSPTFHLSPNTSSESPSNMEATILICHEWHEGHECKIPLLMKLRERLAFRLSYALARIFVISHARYSHTIYLAHESQCNFSIGGSAPDRPVRDGSRLGQFCHYH